MLNKIIHFSIYNRGVVLFLTLLMAVAGVYSFQNLPIDAVPDITNNQVQINTIIDGLAPEEIERTVTYPVESSMRGVAGVEQVRSITRFGLSQVTIIFKDSVDIFRARQLVTERLQGIAESNRPTTQDVGSQKLAEKIKIHYTLYMDAAGNARDGIWHHDGRATRGVDFAWFGKGKGTDAKERAKILKSPNEAVDHEKIVNLFHLSQVRSCRAILGGGI